MKRIALLFSLTLFLAACGGQEPPPPTEQPPVEQPEPPEPPPVTPPPGDPEPPAPPVDDTDALELVEFIPYETDFSDRAVGIVRNTGNQNMQFLRITANFFDSSGQLVATDFTYTDLDIVQPGEEAAFSFYLSDTITDLDNYEVSASWRLTSDPAIRLNVTQATLQDSSSFQEIIGQIENNNSVTRRFAQAVYVCYDDEGQLAASGSTFTDPTDLGAGQTGVFRSSIIGPRTEVDTCDVIAQATDL